MTQRLPPTDDALGLDGFVQPSDEGLSLDELGQAYASLLAKGGDPYELQPKADACLPAIESEHAEAVVAANDEAGFEITPRSIVEAILFVGHPTGEPLTSERLAALMRGVRPAEIDDLVRDLNTEYETIGAPYSIVSVGPGHQLAPRPEFGSLRDAFYGRIREARLSQAAIDILAIVAYHQPVAAAEIERLRGKPSGQVLGQLVRRDLISLHRPAEAKSKPVYQTTRRFLDLFGLTDLSELPQSKDIDREL
jgi:segregation and condensation protein B